MRDKVFEESEEQLIDIYDVKVNYFNISVVSKKIQPVVIYLCYIYIIIIDLNWGLYIWIKKQKIDLFLETKKFFLKEIEYVALELSWELCLKIIIYWLIHFALIPNVLAFFCSARSGDSC